MTALRPMQPPVPVPLVSWRHVMVMTGACLGLGGVTGLGMGLAAVPATIAGLSVSAYGAASAGLRGSFAGGVGFMAVLLALIAAPGMWMLAGLSAALCLAAGIELAARGTRVSVMVLLGLVVVALTQRTEADILLVLPAAAGLVTGYMVLARLGLSGMLRAGPASDRQGLRLGLFLALGMGAALGLVALIDAPRSYWIAIVFVSRALSPRPDARAPLGRYGTGAAIGVVISIGIEALGPPDVLRLCLALGALALALRYLLAPQLTGPAMSTVAVLLGTAPTLNEAVFRAESIGIVIGLVLVVGFVLDGLWRIVVGAGTDVTGP